MFARGRGLKSTYYLRNKSASKIEKSTAIEVVGHDNHNSTDDINVNTSDADACSIEARERGKPCESCQ